MLHVYYGYGKGKTSILNGSAIRAKGANKKVIYFRFLKGRPTNENAIFEKLEIPLMNYHTNEKFVIEMNETEKNELVIVTKKALEEIIKLQTNFDFILIDEVLDLIDTKIISLEDLIIFFKKIDIKNKEVLISGHTKYSEIINLADLVTKLDSEKHYYDTHKIEARKGIEF